MNNTFIFKIKNPKKDPPCLPLEKIEQMKEVVKKYTPSFKDSEIIRSLPETGKIYRHFKGHLYIVLGFAVHSETLQKLILYKRIEENSTDEVWARPASMWFDEVQEGVYRFTLKD